MSTAATLWQPLGEALGMMLLGTVLLAVEFLVFSWGFLSVLAGVCALVAVFIAWSISVATGVAFIVACLVVGLITARIAGRLLALVWAPSSAVRAWSADWKPMMMGCMGSFAIRVRQH